MKKVLKKSLAVLLSVIMMFSMASVCFAADGYPFEDSRYYEQGDYSIHYRVIPSQSEFKGRILFIHGFLYSTSTWESAAKILAADGYECVLADMPNFGYSTRETSDIECISREDLAVGLMESIAPLDEWVVAGHSMGGAIASNIACQHPEIKALMLYAPAVQVEGKASMEKLSDNVSLFNFVQSFVNIILSMKLIIKLAVGIVGKDMKYARNYDTDIFTKPLSAEGTFRGIVCQSARSVPTDFEGLSKLEMPVLLVWASEDSVLAANDCAKISSTLDGIAHTHYVSGGHIFIEVSPETTADITMGFLSDYVY